MKTLFVARQNPTDRKWIPVGKLMATGDKYLFAYTKGATASESFFPLGRMTKLDEVYESNELFPFFANRLVSKNRPEYNEFLQWLNLENDQNVSLEMLGLSGGRRGTDQLEVFQCPEKDENGMLSIKFFSHGISHLDKQSQERVCSLTAGERLFLMRDIQNIFDPSAIAIRTDDPTALVGYFPRYLTSDVLWLIDKVDPDKVHISVSKVNQDAPMQFKLLCDLISPWPSSFVPCSTELYQTIANNISKTCEINEQ